MKYIILMLAILLISCGRKNKPTTPREFNVGDIVCVHGTDWGVIEESMSCGCLSDKPYKYRVNFGRGHASTSYDRILYESELKKGYCNELIP